MEEEISLREIIEVLWKGKFIIILTIIVVVLGTAGVTKFVLSPTYEAVSTVRVGNGAANAEQGYNYNALAESIKTDIAIKRVVDKLELDSELYSVNSIRNALDVQVVKDTSVLKIGMTGKDPSVITDISNQLAFELGLRMEISDRAKKIVDLKQQIIRTDDTIHVLTKAIDEAVQQLETIPEKVTTRQSLANDPFLESIVKDSTGASSKDAAAIQYESENLNPVYTAIAETLAANRIELMRQQANKSNLEDELKLNEEKIKELEQWMDKEKLKATSSERMLDGSNPVFISPAIQPTVPIGPNVLLNAAMSAVIAFIISVAAVFVRHYWKVSEPSNVRSNTNAMTG